MTNRFIGILPLAKLPVPARPKTINNFYAGVVVQH
jgi:hypothetical protein